LKEDPVVPKTDLFLDELSRGLALLLDALKYAPPPSGGLLLHGMDDRKPIPKRASQPKKWLLGLLAVLFVYRLQGEGATKAAALAAVAREVGQEEETVRSWGRRLRKDVLGDELFERLKDLAYNAGRFRAAPEPQSISDNLLALELAFMTFSEFGVRYKRLKAQDERDLLPEARCAMENAIAWRTSSRDRSLESERGAQESA
jgi:hypothetical protein